LYYKTILVNNHLSKIHSFILGLVPSADVANSTLLRVSTDFFLCWGWPADDLFHTLIKVVDFNKVAKKKDRKK
jgi:hypothetical protein